MSDSGASSRTGGVVSRDDLPPVGSEEREDAIRQVLGRFDALRAHARPPAAPPAPRPTTPPPTQVEPTQRSPSRASTPVAAPPDTPAPAIPLPKVVSAPPALQRTAPAPDLPPEEWARRPVLPFRPAAPAQPSTAPRVARTLQSRVAGLERGQTAPLGDEAIANAVARVVLPFIVSTAGGNAVAFPRLTLQQYASLCVELATWPDRVNETRWRYGVADEATWRALQAYWEGKIAASAALRAAREAAEETYRRWLRGESG